MLIKYTGKYVNIYFIMKTTFFEYSRKNILRPRVSKTLNPPPCGMLGLCETGFLANI